MKPWDLLSFFILLMKNGSDKEASIISSRNSSQSYQLKCRAPVYSKMDPLENVAIVRFVRKQSIRVLIFLIVEVHFNVGKNWVQNVVYMSNETNQSLCLPLHFLIRISLFLLLLLNFFGSVSYVTKTFDKFQIQSQVGLSQINVIVPNPSKCELYAVFINWGSGIKFFFLGWQDIANHWDFHS